MAWTTPATSDQPTKIPDEPNLVAFVLLFVADDLRPA
jgi:hypothetical protein